MSDSSSVGMLQATADYVQLLFTAGLFDVVSLQIGCGTQAVNVQTSTDGGVTWTNTTDVYPMNYLKVAAMPWTAPAGVSAFVKIPANVNGVRVVLNAAISPNFISVAMTAGARGVTHAFDLDADGYWAIRTQFPDPSYDSVEGSNGPVAAPAAGATLASITLGAGIWSIQANVDFVNPTTNLESTADIGNVQLKQGSTALTRVPGTGLVVVKKRLTASTTFSLIAVNVASATYCGALVATQISSTT